MSKLIKKKNEKFFLKYYLFIYTDGYRENFLS